MICIFCFRFQTVHDCGRPIVTRIASSSGESAIRAVHSVDSRRAAPLTRDGSLAAHKSEDDPPPPLWEISEFIRFTSNM